MTAVHPARPTLAGYRLSPEIVEQEREQFRYSFLYPSLAERRSWLAGAAAALAGAVGVAWYAATRPAGLGLLGIVALGATVIAWRWVRMLWRDWRRYTPEAERVRDFLFATTLEANAGVHMPGWETSRTAETRAARCKYFTGGHAQGPGTVARMSLRRRVGEAYETARSAGDWRRRQRLGAWMLWLELEPASGDEYIPGAVEHQNPMDRRFAEAVVAIARKEMEHEHPWRARAQWPAEPFTLPRDVMVRGNAFAMHEVAHSMLTGGVTAMAAAVSHWGGLGADTASRATLADLLGLVGRIEDVSVAEMETIWAWPGPAPAPVEEPPADAEQRVPSPHHLTRLAAYLQDYEMVPTPRLLAEAAALTPGAGSAPTEEWLQQAAGRLRARGVVLGARRWPAALEHDRAAFARLADLIERQRHPRHQVIVAPDEAAPLLLHAAVRDQWRQSGPAMARLPDRQLEASFDDEVIAAFLLSAPTTEAWRDRASWVAHYLSPEYLIRALRRRPWRDGVVPDLRVLDPARTHREREVRHQAANLLDELGPELPAGALAQL